MTPEEAPRPHSKAIEDTYSAIKELDVLIRQHADILEIIQPFAPGKISVRFIKVSGGGVTEPVFVAWRWTAEGRKQRKLIHYDLLPLSLATRSIKRYGPFAGTQDDVRDLIVPIKRLIDRRKALTVILGKCAQASSISKRAARGTISELGAGLHEKMLSIHQRHIGRMKDYRDKLDANKREAAEKEARYVVVDPTDYDVFAPPPREEVDDGRSVLPDSYLDEDGNYVGP